MFTVIQRTHVEGRQLAPQDLEKPVAGTVLRKTRYDAVARRQQVYMEFTPLGDPATEPVEGSPPDLLDPQILSFDSERGMMLVGFELINGGRLYQGWWVRWFCEKPEWYRPLETPG